MILTCLLFFVQAAWLGAQTTDARDTIVKDFVEQRANNASLYQSPPINHIVPAFNTITYAGQFEEVNLRLMAKPQDNFPLNKYAAVTVTGFKLEPHLALSLKNICLGFSIVRSKLEEEYLLKYPEETFEQRQKSSLETSGLGLNVAFVPFTKIHKQLKLAFILSGQNLNVKHSLSYLKALNGPVTIEESEMQKFQYTVNNYSAGMNLSWFVFKHFSIVPWMDYSMTDLAEAKGIASSNRYTDTGLKPIMENDWNLFFLSYPKFRYGLDFSVQVLGLEVRIGGLLGSLASLNKSVDYIEDKSILLSVSVEQKGN